MKSDENENRMVAIEANDEVHYLLAEEGETHTVCGEKPGKTVYPADDLPTCHVCAVVAMPSHAWRERFGPNA